MDLDSFDPNVPNALNLASRYNKVELVEQLLNKKNVEYTDEKGRTCLHEAAGGDSYESLMLILKHPDCNPLAETDEGHTALYYACRYSKSLRIIQALLENVPDIANYGSKEYVTPLHITSHRGRIDCMELLIKYGAMVDAQDVDGDTPLHEAAGSLQPDAVNLLLYSNADPEIKNESSFTPLHLACYKGCMESVRHLMPFTTDINMRTCNGDSLLNLGTIGSNENVVKYLLEHGADPNLPNWHGDIALSTAIKMEDSKLCKILMEVTDLSKLCHGLIRLSCKPDYFNYDIVTLLVTHLGQELFEYYDPYLRKVPKISNNNMRYLIQAPLNTYFNICEHVYKTSPEKFKILFYLFLMRGFSVNPMWMEECPPLVFIQLRSHETCFKEVFKILLDHGCNVDHCSFSSCTHEDMCIPDAFFISVYKDPSTALTMLPFSLQCDPDILLKFAIKNNALEKFQPQVTEKLLSMIGLENPKMPVEYLPYTVSPLKHLSRLKIRHTLRKRRGIVKSTKLYLKALNEIKLPETLINYLRYK